MKFHTADFGPFSGHLQKFADTQGYIPAQGSPWQAFQWPGLLHQKFADPRTGDACWQQFCQQAEVAVTQQFQALLDLEDVPLQTAQRVKQGMTHSGYRLL
ncbi:MAG: hypothetical protein ICV62_14310 [Cyanobacteria bacterium Co-bin13]|nr:hypothetical protein [Cyanobacteria bacterium Co-bin13]